MCHTILNFTYVLFVFGCKGNAKCRNMKTYAFIFILKNYLYLHFASFPPLFLPLCNLPPCSSPVFFTHCHFAHNSRPLCPSTVGWKSRACLTPGYFPDKGHCFAPFATRDDADSIQKGRIDSDHYDGCRQKREVISSNSPWSFWR